jgi:hypothetical protein
MCVCVCVCSLFFPAVLLCVRMFRVIGALSIGWRRGSDGRSQRTAGYRSISGYRLKRGNLYYDQGVCVCVCVCVFPLDVHLCISCSRCLSFLTSWPLLTSCNCWNSPSSLFFLSFRFCLLMFLLSSASLSSFVMLCSRLLPVFLSFFLLVSIYGVCSVGSVSYPRG